MATLSHRTQAQSSRREAIEARVLEAAEELLAEGHPYAELRVEQIATRAGIGRSAFYFYFRDKRELLMRLSEGIAELLYAEAEAWWSGDGDGAAQLRSALERVLTLYRDHAVVLRAAVEASAYDEAVAGFWRALVGRFAEATRRRIEEEQAAGRVGPLPAEDVAFALAWMSERAMYQRHVQGLDLADPDFVASLVHVWSGAIYGRLD